MSTYINMNYIPYDEIKENHQYLLISLRDEVLGRCMEVKTFVISDTHLSIKYKQEQLIGLKTTPIRKKSYGVIFGLRNIV